MIIITVLALLAEYLLTLLEGGCCAGVPPRPGTTSRSDRPHPGFRPTRRTAMPSTPVRVSAAALAALTALSSLSACRDSRAGSGGGGGSGGTVKIMVGGIDKVIYLPAKLTERLGYFKEQGLDVQLLTEPAGAQAENVLISGDVQAVVGFYDHSIHLQAKGKCVQSVVQMADVPGEAEMVAASRRAP